VLTFGLFTSAVALADGLWALGTLRFLAGLGLGGALPNAAALASEYVPRRHRPFAITLTIVCVPLGGTLAAFVGGRAMPILGWRTVFAIGGLLSAAVAVILMRYLPESPRYLARHPQRWPELAAILRRLGHVVPSPSQSADRAGDPRTALAFVDSTEQVVERTSMSVLFTPAFRRDTLALWGAFFSCLLAVYIAFNWVPAMLTGAGVSLGVAGDALAAFNLGGVAGAVGGGLVIARLGSKPTMLAMSAGAIAGAIALAVTPITSSTNAIVIIGLLGFTGALINAVQTTMYALAAHVYPTMVRATGVGTAVAVGRSGGVLSSYAGSWALEAGSAAFFGLMAASMTMVFVCLASVRRHVPRPEPRGQGPEV
jgi:AAHS family 4-hydroxybenzoate transporter-like MFS transporter